MGKGLILGFFDGVHSAHQKVIQSALEYAEETVLVTFKNSPAEYFTGHAEYIYPRTKSIEKIKMLGIDEVLELDFEQIAKMSAQEYLEFLVKEFSPISISTGFNHTFGMGREGNSEFLAKNQSRYGYKYFCVPKQIQEGETVSSTLIKSLLRNGDIERANKLLMSNFVIQGNVIKGNQIGRTIGFPTANINYPEKIVKIPYGVYAAKIIGRGKSRGKYRGEYGEHSAIVNWGMKPTVNKNSEPVAEVHILGFEGDLYGQDIEVEVLKKIRDEKKFGSLEELKAQIKKDVEECLEL